MPPAHPPIAVLQKWSKGKVRDKLNNLVFFDKPTYDKLYKEVPSYKLITPSVVSERLKVRGSLAKRALQELHAKGKTIHLSIAHNFEHLNGWILTRLFFRVVLYSPNIHGCTSTLPK